ncbi:MAG: 2-octaprenyl-6-methoxyphenyl hydroxylase [Gammaproteobacteria bacterium]|nr:2-octaprenyl-6-methoxyphenyl hydroxylase [Gammaproteobacteria bacterium]
MSTAPASHGPRAGGRRERHYAVVVAGGGLVGMTLAVALGRGRVPVGLVEAPPAPGPGAGARDPRPIALAESSRRILAALDLWPALAPLATPIRSIHVSDRGRFGFARLHARDVDLAALGHVVEADDLARVLGDALGGMTGVHRLGPATVSAARLAADRLLLELGSAEPSHDVGASLLVVCDGGRSPLRESLGIAVRSHDYRQSAIAARVRPRRGHGFVAYERFTSAGPLALLPMADGWCGLVWSLPSERAREVAALPDTAFLASLSDVFGRRMGAFVESGPRVLFPLQLVSARSVVQPRLAVIGNAAHHLHPVAGQGLNLGLRDVAALVDVIVTALREDGDPGADAGLERYAAARRDDHRRVRRATDALVRLFGNDWIPVAAVRDLGLLGLDLLPPLKRRFTRAATGLAGRASRLERGLAP